MAATFPLPTEPARRAASLSILFAHIFHSFCAILLVVASKAYCLSAEISPTVSDDGCRQWPQAAFWEVLLETGFSAGLLQQWALGTENVFWLELEVGSHAVTMPTLSYQG